jgi:hypothetical protein
MSTYHMQCAEGLKAGFYSSLLPSPRDKAAFGMYQKLSINVHVMWKRYVLSLGN